jgi:hypothetical protein
VRSLPRPAALLRRQGPFPDVGLRAGSGHLTARLLSTTGGAVDITELIMSDHHEQRRMFALLDEAGEDPAVLGPIWRRLAILLEVHAAAEEKLFYPTLMQVGEGAGGQSGPGAETKDAIGDHNDIRDAVHAAEDHDVGSQEWWQSVLDAREANSDHMAEEEREALADFRLTVTGPPRSSVEPGAGGAAAIARRAPAR